MDNENDTFIALCNHLKRIGDSTHAGRVYVDFTKENGDVFRVEYKPSKKTRS